MKQLLTNFTPTGSWSPCWTLLHVCKWFLKYSYSITIDEPLQAAAILWNGIHFLSLKWAQISSVLMWHHLASQRLWLNQFQFYFIIYFYYRKQQIKVSNSSFRVLFWELYTFYCVNIFQKFSDLIHITKKVTVGMCIAEMECESQITNCLHPNTSSSSWISNQPAMFQFQFVRRSWVMSFTLPCVSGKTHWFWSWCSQTIIICHPTLKSSHPKWQPSKWMPNEDESSFLRMASCVEGITPMC